MRFKNGNSVILNENGIKEYFEEEKKYFDNIFMNWFSTPSPISSIFSDEHVNMILTKVKSKEVGKIIHCSRVGLFDIKFSDDFICTLPKNCINLE